MNPTFSAKTTVEVENPKVEDSRIELNPPQIRVDLAGQTHQGKVRQNNEDHFLITRFGRFLETIQTNLPDESIPKNTQESGYALIVADGMGGHEGGEQASRLAITTLLDLVLSTPDWILRVEEGHLPDEIMKRAIDRFTLINQALALEAAINPALRGFGTTLTMAWGLGAEMFVAHLGDSRAYLFRKGHLHRLTRDHTMAQELVDQKLLTWQQASAFRLRHVLTQSLGDHGSKIRTDVMRVLLEDKDCVLLCSDGLNDMLDDKEIAVTLALPESSTIISQRLIEKAVAAGGNDNVTALVAQFDM